MTDDEDSDYRHETSYKDSFKDRRRQAHTQAEQKRRDAIKVKLSHTGAYRIFFEENEKYVFGGVFFVKKFLSKNFRKDMMTFSPSYRPASSSLSLQWEHRRSAKLQYCRKVG